MSTKRKKLKNKVVRQSRRQRKLRFASWPSEVVFLCVYLRYLSNSMYVKDCRRKGQEGTDRAKESAK